MGRLWNLPTTATPTDRERRVRRAFRIYTVISIVVIYILLVAVDTKAFHLFFDPELAKGDVALMFRVLGIVPTWIILAVAFLLIDLRGPEPRTIGNRWSRGLLITLCVLISGGVSELGKILIRRERPIMHDGLIVFRDWSERTFSTSGLSTPSGHTIIAFAGAWMLCYLHPQARIIWIFMAIGCGAGRVISGGHFISDTFLSAVLAFIIARLLWVKHLRNNNATWQNGELLR